MSIPRELWLSNLIGAARSIADAERQQSRWLAPDAATWERPAELLCMVVDDCCLELFIKEQGPSLTSDQLNAATDLFDLSMKYDAGPTGWRDPNEVLNDPEWESRQNRAQI